MKIIILAQNYDILHVCSLVHRRGESWTCAAKLRIASLSFGVVRFHFLTHDDPVYPPQSRTISLTVSSNGVRHISCVSSPFWDIEELQRK